MGVVLPFQRAEEDTPHLRGPAKCLHCKTLWEVVVPVGHYCGFECPHCSLLCGVLLGLVEPQCRWMCECGCDLFYILEDGCQCLRCGTMNTQEL